MHRDAILSTVVCTYRISAEYMYLCLASAVGRRGVSVASVTVRCAALYYSSICREDSRNGVGARSD